MRIKQLKYLAAAFIVIGAISTDSYSLSTAAKSEIDYTYLMRNLRNVQVIIENFANEQQKQKYTDLTNDFRNASVDFYAHNFVFFDKASKKYKMKFYLVKMKLSDLLDEMAKAYIDRSADMLRATSKDSFNILIKFSKGGYSKYFTRPIDPVSRVQGEMLYKSEEYHLYHDKGVIEQYLRKGYNILGEAKRIYEHPDMQTIKAKTERNDYDINFMVDNYLTVIDQCRQAKQYAIEIFRLIRRNNVYAVQKKLEQYNISLTNPLPVFDVRIPENYKVDANDNEKLVHAIELKKLPADFPKSPFSDAQ